MEQHGFVETDIDRVAMEMSVDTLADLENLALKHEVRRKATVRELGTPAQKTQQAIDEAGPRLNGKVRVLAQDLPEEPSLSPTEPPP